MKSETGCLDTQGTFHCDVYPLAISHHTYRFPDCRNTAPFREIVFAGRTCVVLWHGDNSVILCYLPDLFWSNNVPVQKGNSSAQNKIEIVERNGIV